MDECCTLQIESAAGNIILTFAKLREDSKQCFRIGVQKDNFESIPLKGDASHLSVIHGVSKLSVLLKLVWPKM